MFILMGDLNALFIQFIAHCVARIFNENYPFLSEKLQSIYL